MGDKSATITTSLTVQQCAAIFQGAPKQLMSGAAKAQGLVARVAGGVFTADFFTPEDTGPFAALDDDRPDFSVGTWIRNGMSAPNPTELHMYVWDRGDHRDVLIAAGHGMVTGSMHAKKLLDKLAEMIKTQDRSARVSTSY